MEDSRAIKLPPPIADDMADKASRDGGGTVAPSGGGAAAPSGGGVRRVHLVAGAAAPSGGGGQRLHQVASTSSARGMEGGVHRWWGGGRRIREGDGGSNHGRGQGGGGSNHGRRQGSDGSNHGLLYCLLIQI
jgi:hypothetical protein